jgi:translation initiation factor 3 subunit H
VLFIAICPISRYQSATLGTFQTAELIETFMNYHENIRKCVCLIYDPHVSLTGR